MTDYVYPFLDFPSTPIEIKTTFPIKHIYDIGPTYFNKKPHQYVVSYLTQDDRIIVETVYDNYEKGTLPYYAYFEEMKIQRIQLLSEKDEYYKRNFWDSARQRENAFHYAKYRNGSQNLNNHKIKKRIRSFLRRKGIS